MSTTPLSWKILILWSGLEALSLVGGLAVFGADCNEDGVDDSADV